MNPKFLLGLLALPLLAVNFAFAQVSVDHLTGGATVNLPLYTFRQGNIAIPISLSYYSNGVRAKDVEGNAGMGWNLNAGGSITRELRDLPDDYPTSNRGMLYNSNIANIASFNISNDNNTGTCSDETSDLSYISTYFDPLSDTEPDIFHINVPGISCKLIFDADHQPRTIPYTDIKVSYVTDGYGIRSFRIISDKGIVYDFERGELAYRKSTSPNPSAIQFFKDVYNKYATQIGYYRKWHLTKITDDANVVTLGYTIPNFVNKFSKNPYEFYIGNTSTKTTQFYIDEFGPNYVVDTIKTPYTEFNRVVVGHSVNPYTGMPVAGGLIANERSWSFTYDAARVDTTTASYTRMFLSAVSEAGVSSPTGYQFFYDGLSGSNYSTRHTTLPDSSSKKLDRWGYYDAAWVNTLQPQIYINPSNAAMDRFNEWNNSVATGSYPYYVSGRVRDPNPLVIKAGALNKVIDIKGSATTIAYELNNYYDPQLGENINGGGIRVKRIQEYDLTDTTRKKTLNYSYLDPVSGNSSGKPISLPVFAFLRPYTGSGTTEQTWQESVVRSEENLSSESTGILYGHVTEAIAGMGSKRYTFLVPATHFDTSASPDWAPIVTNVAGCAGAGYLVNEKNTYPFVYNLDVNFERGRLGKLQLFNESGQKVSQSNYAYSRIGTAAYIPGLKYSLNNGITAYAKYFNVVDINNETVTQIDTLYDIANSSQQASTVTYAFESANHQYPTKVERNNSDGSTTTVITKYSKDYSLSVANEAPVTALKELVTRNVNIPVENYTQVTRGGTTKTIAAELVKFGKFEHPSVDLYKPVQTLSLISADGLSDFSVSTITGGYLVKDSRYIPVTNFLDYNEKGALLASKPVNGKISATLYQDYSFIPKAAITNAMPSEIVDADFEYLWYSDVIEFGRSAPDTYPARSGKRGFELGGATEPYFNFTKKTGASYYLFSIWIKSATANNLTVTVGSDVYYLPFGISASWKYYQMKIPVGALSGSIQLKVKSTATINIDDILFYPADATVGTQTTDHFKQVKTSETTTNGLARYYDYDSYNRLKHVYDEDRNIILKKSYVLAGDAAKFTTSINDVGSEFIYNTSYNFGPMESGDGLAYTWNFGDGTPTVNSTGAAVSHTYTAVGTYTITFTKYSPLYGTSTDTHVVSVVNPSSVRLLSNSGINVAVYQGSTLIDYYSDFDLATFNITLAPGIYTLRAIALDPYGPSNTSGYLSVKYTANGPNNTAISQDCQSSSPGVNTYDFYVNLTGKEQIQFSLDYGSVCTLGGGEVR